jgi:hypothetical protein
VFLCTWLTPKDTRDLFTSHMAKKPASQRVVTFKKSKSDLLPPIRIASGARESISREAEAEGNTISAYLRSCIWLGRAKKGHIRGVAAASK